jgi:hypothetical protein
LQEIAPAGFKIRSGFLGRRMALPIKKQPSDFYNPMAFAYNKDPNAGWAYLLLSKRHGLSVPKFAHGANPQFARVFIFSAILIFVTHSPPFS